MNLYGMVGNDVVGRWDILGNAPGDTHATIEGAIDSGARYIAGKTEVARRLGIVEFMLRYKLDPATGSLPKREFGSGSFFKVFNFMGGNISILFGIEHSIDIYCTENLEGQKVFQEGTVCEGSFPDDAGGIGQVDPTGSVPQECEEFPLGDHILVARLHTHNIGRYTKTLPGEVPDIDGNVPQGFEGYEVGDPDNAPASQPDKDNKVLGIQHFTVYDDGEKEPY